MRKKAEKLPAHDPLFGPITRVTWLLPSYHLTEAQNNKIEYITKKFKELMDDNHDFKNESVYQPHTLNPNKSSYYLTPKTIRGELGRTTNKMSARYTKSNHIKQSKLRVKRDIEEFTRKMSRNLALTNEGIENFEDFHNLDNFGLKTTELQQLFSVINTGSSGVVHVAFYTRLLNIPRYNMYLEKLEEYGYYISCFEDFKLVSNFPKYTVILAPTSEVEDSIPNLEHYYQMEKQIAEVLVFRDDDKQAYNNVKNKTNFFKFFDQFSSLLEFLIINVT